MIKSCDICSAPEANSLVSASALRGAVRRGFNPFHLGLIPPSLARLATPDYPAKWSQEAMEGVMSKSDWILCSACELKLAPYHPPG